MLMINDDISSRRSQSRLGTSGLGTWSLKTDKIRRVDVLFTAVAATTATIPTWPETRLENL